MTDTTLHRTASSRPVLAAAGTGLALALTAVGTFWDVTGNDDGQHGAGGYLVTAGIVAVGTALVFGVVGRTAGPVTSLVRAASTAWAPGAKISLAKSKRSGRAAKLKGTSHESTDNNE